MERDRETMENYAGQVVLNLGCGFDKMVGAINVDAFDNCDPDVCWDLNKTPLPFDDNSVDKIIAQHVFEHLKRETWWDTFCDCARILKPGGFIEIAVPDESSSSAWTYRDHHHIIARYSFHGIAHDSIEGTNFRSFTNAWAKTVENTIPVVMISHIKVPFWEYKWMRFFPWLVMFCSNHLRNFIWEQRFIFRKIVPGVPQAEYEMEGDKLSIKVGGLKSKKIIPIGGEHE